MNLINDLVNNIEKDAPVRNILIGAHWTAISSLRCGMASTVMSQKPHGEDLVQGAGSLHQKSARELTAYLLSDNTLEASIGLAALNSLLEIPEKNIKVINAFQVVAEKGVGKNVAIFGHFPYIEEVRKTAKDLSVFELSPTGKELSLDQVPSVLPQAEIVAITSNSIINHTIEDILPHLNPEAFSVLVGPSTPLSPLMFEAGFDMLAGVRVLDEDAIFQSVGQAATFKQVRGKELITIIK